MKQVFPKFYNPVKPYLEDLSKHFSIGKLISYSSDTSCSWSLMKCAFFKDFIFTPCYFGTNKNWFIYWWITLTSYKRTSVSATFTSSRISSSYKTFPLTWIGVGSNDLISCYESFSISKYDSPNSNLHNLAIFISY